MKWQEIKKWADSHSITVKKKPKEEIYYYNDQEYDNSTNLVRAIYNKITDNKWVEHQKKYDANI